MNAVSDQCSKPRASFACLEQSPRRHTSRRFTDHSFIAGLSGKLHEGAPTGNIETIDNLQTYVAAPKDGSKAKSIVFLVDIFGWEFKNVRLLADNYAKAGFYCYVPDVHQGDSIPLDFLNSVEPPLKVREQQSLIDKTKATATVGTTLPPWLVKHREGVTKVSQISQLGGRTRADMYLSH